MSHRRRITHEEPLVSVVIPTLPDRDLEAVVSALREQSEDRFELVVVSDGSLGVCEARNEGLRAATAPIVAFTDDDCLPPHDWIANICAAFETGDLVIVEGPVSGGLQYDGTRLYPTCNVAVARDVALEVGGFRSEYEYWREDTEFGWRMEDAGGFRYDPAIRMRHPDSSRSNIKVENERRLKAEYPDRYEKLVIPDSLAGRVNDWLWRRGFWDAVDRVRRHG